mmetsp:Transcript_103516/g.297427  ORF Transcript_103516/g.297427 Transcript_103516/m.297427 type:complete len:511 (-) Transcript_103516:1599-3131(-)
MQKWLEAEVIGEQAGSVKVHFKNWHVKFDEWLPRASERIRPYGRHKKLVKVPPASRQLSLKRAQSQERVRRMASTSAQFDRYQGALAEGGLHVHPVEGDGNCMFRSVSHQIYGDDRHHMLVRQMCMDYMESEKEYFEPYVVGDMDDFLAYLGQKRRNAVWGDDPEVQAMCELYDRPAEIWGFDPKAGARKLRTFHETSGSNHDRQPMRLSYYGGGHYDSIVGPGHAENVSRAAPGVTEQARIEWSRARAACSDVEETKQQSDVAATEAAELDLALAASRSDFDRQAVDLECIFSEVQQLEWATSQADLERTNEELVHSIAAQSAREHDRVQDLEALKRSEELELQQALAMSSQGATANGADDEQLQRGESSFEHDSHHRRHRCHRCHRRHHYHYPPLPPPSSPPPLPPPPADYHHYYWKALAMSAAGGDDFERALALSSAQVGAGGAADASADELQRALAMSAAEAGPTGLDPELEIALALSSNEGGGGFTADEDDEVMRAIALSRQGFS